MGNRLLVRGGRTLLGTAPLVGDKSISHRALLLGALADGTTRVRNLSPCAAVERTLACLQDLGVSIQRQSEREAVVHGVGPAGLSGPPVHLDCGDIGTTMRLLAGILVGQDREFVLDGAPGLRQRPMDRVVVPLRQMGARIEATEGHPPLRGTGGRLVGAEITLEKASAQVGSAVLLAGLNASGATTVRYPQPVRDHTERMLAEFRVPIEWNGTASQIVGPVSTLTPPGGGITVPDDISAAAFLLAAGTILPGSAIRLTDVGMNPGRTGFLEILTRMGAQLTTDSWAKLGGEPTASLGVSFGYLRGIEVGQPLVARAIDELPLVAVLGSQARGRTVIFDAAELRVKETDRIAAIVEGLTRMGAAVEERPDGLVVEGPTRLSGTTVEGYEDHRIVMALAAAGLVAEGETTITNADRVADSFPGFVETLGELGADVNTQPE